MSKVSIIIPAFNEEVLLPKTLTHLNDILKSVSFESELIVVDNNSTDHTAKIARDFGAQVVFAEKNNIAVARNAGGYAATGNYLIFIDADTLVDKGLLEEVFRLLESKRISAGGAAVTFDTPLRLPLRLLTDLWNVLAGVFKLAAGSFVFCLKEGFEAVGGFDEAFYASEEIGFSRRINKWGKKRNLSFVVISAYPVITSGRKMEWYSTWGLCSKMILLICFPFLLKNKKACRLWYDRPENG
jgi:glycosyltransferase involved in cell wall biosynthesis